jgi:hypothetical protein
MANREAIQKWADALEFSDLDKVQGDLRLPVHKGNHTYTWGYCGLGVACKVYAEEFGVSIGRMLDDESWVQADGYVPAEVEDWLDIDRDVQKKIVNMNDSEQNDSPTLPEIGTWVRENLLKDE